MKILINDEIDFNAVKKLKENFFVTTKHYSQDELIRQIKRFDLIIVRSSTIIDKKIIESGKKGLLKYIIRAGVGLDNIDIEYAKEKGIKVFNTPKASTRAVAELVIGHIFSIYNNIQKIKWDLKNDNFNKENYQRNFLKNKTLGIIGFGRIGKKVAELALALNMKVLYYTKSGKKSDFEKYKYVNFNELLKESDIITIHIPFKKGNDYLISTNELSLMKENSIIINTARGGIINEEALIGHLKSEKIMAAALDVFESEPVNDKNLYKNSQISLSPHIGGYTREAQWKIGKEVIEIINNIDK